MDKLFIAPFDTLFFRDGKPFNKGVNSLAHSEFSIIPSNFYGAIASSFFVNNSSNANIFGKYLRDKEGNYGSFHLKGVFLSKRANDKVYLYMPVPLDTYAFKVRDALYLKFLTCRRFNEGDVKDFQLDLYFYSDSNPEEISGKAFITSEHFESKYMNCKDKGFRLYSDMVTYENKVGITIDKAGGASEEGMLYQTQYFRLKEKFGFTAFFEGLDGFEKQGFLKLGGKSKSAHYETINGNIIKNLFSISVELKNVVFEQIDKSKFMKLYFATPAIFENGWLPDGFDKKTFVFHNGNFVLKIIAAAIGRYKSISGWDMLNYAPKMGYRAVPAGSVYYIKVVKGKVEDIFDYFNGKNFGIRKEEGFGLSFVVPMKGECI